MPKKYRTALVVGRFQPFHKGHLYLMQTAIDMADTVKIAIGSSNSTDLNSNPLSYEQRKKMIETVVAHEGWSDRVTTIVPSPDFPSDEEWRDTLTTNAGEFDIAVGNNDWTNSVLRDAGYEATTIPFKQRDVFQGVYIRELLRSDGEWKERIPEYLVEEVIQLFV